MAFACHIVGAGRSGTTLLANLINAHPRCRILIEVYSSAYLMGGTQTPADLETDLRKRTALRIDNFLNACYDRAALEPDRLWGHKTTTEHISGLRWGVTQSTDADGFDPLDEFCARTAHIPTIFILRDGRTCIPSKVRRQPRLKLAIYNWKLAVELLYRLRETAQALHVVKFEDLVHNPESELTRICGFLGIGYDAAMLNGTAKVPEHDRRQGFDPAPAEVVDRAPPWLWRIEDEMRDMGYLDGACPRSMRG